MFILRKITGDGLQMNFALGDDYNFVDKEANPKEFNSMKDFFKWDDEVYAFVSYKDGARTMPLYPKQKAFIMTESGKTFANVSQR